MESSIINLNFRPLTYSHPTIVTKIACQNYKISKPIHNNMLNDMGYLTDLSLYINKEILNNHFFYAFDKKYELTLTLSSRMLIVKYFYMAVLLSNHDSICMVCEKSKILGINKLISEQELSFILDASPKVKTNKPIRHYYTLRSHLYVMLCEMISTWLLLLPIPLSNRMKLKLPSRYFLTSFTNQKKYFDNLFWLIENQ